MRLANGHDFGSAFSRSGICFWLLVIAAPADLSASWPPDGLPLSTASGYQSSVTIAPDGQGGFYAAWADAQSGRSEIILQRVGANGNVAAGWPLAGLPVCTALSSQVNPICVSDGLGGAVVVWKDDRDGVDYSIYAQRLLADGTIPQGWPTTGAPVFVGGTVSTLTTWAQWMRVVTDGSGGAYVAMQFTSKDCVPDHPGCMYLQYGPQVIRLLASGARGGPGGTVGHPYPYLEFDMVSDGTGGAITAGHLTAQPLMVCRLSPTGTWLKETSLGTGAHRRASLAPDGSGGVFIACEISTATNSSDVWAQRLTATGTVHAGWPAEGRPVSEGPGFQGYPEAARGEPGQLIVSWLDTRGLASNSPFDDANVFAQMVGPGGAPVPGWPANGASVCSAPKRQSEQQVAYDGLGGAWVTWLDSRDSPASPQSLFATRLTPTGDNAFDWPLDGKRITPSVATYSRNGLVPSGSDGAITAWGDRRSGVNWQDDIYAQRLVGDGPVSTLIDIVSVAGSPGRVDLVGFISGQPTARIDLFRRTEEGASITIASLHPDGEGRVTFRDLDVVPEIRYWYRLEVQVEGSSVSSREVSVLVPAELRLTLTAPYLNTGRHDLTSSLNLTGSAPASLELIDPTGRRLTELDLEDLGAGTHTVSFPNSRGLPTGVYLIRLSEGGSSIVRKACLIR